MWVRVRVRKAGYLPGEKLKNAVIPIPYPRSCNVPELANIPGYAPARGLRIARGKLGAKNSPRIDPKQMVHDYPKMTVFWSYFGPKMAVLCP